MRLKVPNAELVKKFKLAEGEGFDFPPGVDPA